jgi:segregation and condensation protein B
MTEAPDRPDDSPKEISLDELTQAFAQVMGAEPRAEFQADAQPPAEAPAGDRAETVATAPGPEQAADETPPRDAPVVADVEAEPACEVCPRTILEAMFFVGNRASEPLSAGRAAELMRGVEQGDVLDLVDELNRRYAADGCPYEIVSEGSGYRLVLRKSFCAIRNRFYGRTREARLSQAAIDVLAIVAYQQPIDADRVSQMRDKPSGHILSQLLRRGLLRIERKQVEGKKKRVVHFFTTDRFLEMFGLESLEDLPKTEDMTGG